MATLSSTKLLLTRDDLPRLGLNYSNSTLLRWEREGRFPKRVRIGGHSVAWFVSEIHDFVDSLAQAREASR